LLSTADEGTSEETRTTFIQAHPTLVWETTRREDARSSHTRREREEVTSGGDWVVTRGAQRIEGNSLVLPQVNCRSIYKKSLDFWDLIDTYNPDVIIGTESRLREEISNAEVFRDETRLSGETAILRVVECSVS
jgi:hypothetical protein